MQDSEDGKVESGYDGGAVWKKQWNQNRYT